MAVNSILGLLKQSQEKKIADEQTQLDNTLGVGKTTEQASPQQQDDPSLAALFAPKSGEKIGVGGSTTSVAVSPGNPVASAEVTPLGTISSPANAVDTSFMQGLDPDDVARLEASMDILRNTFGQPDLVANATKNILVLSKQHPEFSKILLPSDIGLMVRALRERTGVLQVTKSLAKGKRKAQKETSQETIDAMKDFMGDMDQYLVK